ncbi:MAG: hypothetical protein SGBAC_007866 [Bacillariaceae sp.]
MTDAPELDGLSSLVQLSGYNVPARARFVGEAMVSSLLASVTVGLSFGMVGALTPAGPLLPFMVGSWTGYSVGLLKHWHTSSQRMVQYARLYPSLLSHALETDRFIFVPKGVVQASEDKVEYYESNPGELMSKKASPKSLDKPTLEDWIRDGSLDRWSWAMLAAQTCLPDVEELQRTKRQKIMDEYNER